MRWSIGCLTASTVLAASVSTAQIDALYKDGKPVARLEEMDVHNLLGNKNRDFALLTLIGTRDCPQCQALQQDFERVLTTKLAKYDLVYENLPVYPVYVDARKSAALTRSLELQSVPHIFLFTPQNWKCKGGRVDPSSCWTSATPIVSAKDYELDRLSAAIGRALKFDKAIIADLSHTPSKITKSRIALGILALSMFGVICFQYIQDFILRFGLVRSFLGLVVFWLSTSGLVYSWNEQQQLLNTRFFGKAKDGSIIWFSANPRKQYLGEGLLFSALTIICSLSLFLALSMQSIARRMGLANKVPWLATTVGLLFGLLSVFLYVQLRDVLMNKHNYYPGSFFPDRSFHRGSHRVDRAYAI